MSKVDDGGSAFPIPAYEEGTLAGRFSSGHPPQPGMSIRDWFAGQALAGLLASPHTSKIDKLPELAFCIADAMLKQRMVEGAE
jgi:hypothetical protein